MAHHPHFDEARESLADQFGVRNGRIVITGFNTDVEYDGVIYHVQTEDKGINSPLILSLVYTGGAILASKRSPYNDLIADGFDEEVLAERLKRQHKLICAAIKSGRIDDLKKMGNRSADDAVAVEDGSEVGAEPDSPIPAPAAPPPPAIEDTRIETGLEHQEPPRSAVAPADAYMVFDSRRKAVQEDQGEGLHLSLLEEQEFRSGEALTLGVLVTYRSGDDEKPLSGVAVSVKVLGTSFRPVIVSMKTQKDGVAMVSAEIPRFTGGRAAILVRAVKGGESVEIRRVVHPSN